MNSINCLIIDDEPLARSLIRTLLNRHGGFNILAECTNPTEAYESLLNHPIKVIFLDIQMPVISGIDFLQSLQHPPKVIFTTAHASFAADAFTLNAVDYLVKPFTPERFSQAIDKLKQSLIEPVDLTTASQVDYVFFKVDGKLTKLEFEDILYLEALKDFTRIYMKTGKSLLIGEHLKAVESQLPGSQFIRVHRSFVVSIKAVTGILGNTLELADLQVPMGGSYRQDVMGRLGIH